MQKRRLIEHLRISFVHMQLANACVMISQAKLCCILAPAGDLAAPAGSRAQLDNECKAICLDYKVVQGGLG